jgi:phosphoserine aminotransferase
MSHRSTPIIEVMDKARSLVKELLGAPDHYEVAFLGGGASMGFHMIPHNYLKDGGRSAYANTG